MAFPIYLVPAALISFFTNKRGLPTEMQLRPLGNVFLTREKPQPRGPFDDAIKNRDRNHLDTRSKQNTYETAP